MAAGREVPRLPSSVRGQARAETPQAARLVQHRGRTPGGRKPSSHPPRIAGEGRKRRRALRADRGQAIPGPHGSFQAAHRGTRRLHGPAWQGPAVSPYARAGLGSAHQGSGLRQCRQQLDGSARAVPRGTGARSQSAHHDASGTPGLPSGRLPLGGSAGRVGRGSLSRRRYGLGQDAAGTNSLGGARPSRSDPRGRAHVGVPELDRGGATVHADIESDLLRPREPRRDGAWPQRIRPARLQLRIAAPRGRAARQRRLADDRAGRSAGHQEPRDDALARGDGAERGFQDDHHRNADREPLGRVMEPVQLHQSRPLGFVRLLRQEVRRADSPARQPRSEDAPQAADSAVHSASHQVGRSRGTPAPDRDHAPGRDVPTREGPLRGNAAAGHGQPRRAGRGRRAKALAHSRRDHEAAPGMLPPAASPAGHQHPRLKAGNVHRDSVRAGGERAQGLGVQSVRGSPEHRAQALGWNENRLPVLGRQHASPRAEAASRQIPSGRRGPLPDQLACRRSRSESNRR